MSARESQRLAWRRNLDAAHREYVAARTRFLDTVFIGPSDLDGFSTMCVESVRGWDEARAAWKAALSAPKPWARPRDGADLGRDGDAIRYMAQFKTPGDFAVFFPASLTWDEVMSAWNVRESLRRKRRAAQRRQR